MYQPTPRRRTRGDYVSVPGSSNVPLSGGRRIQSPWYRSHGEAVAWRPSNCSMDMSVPSWMVERFSGDVMDDYVVPNFRKRLASGELIPTNPRSLTRTAEGFYRNFVAARAIRQSGVYWYAEWSWNTVLFTPGTHLPPSPPVNGVLIEAHAKMQAGFMDALTSAAELGKTIKLITGFKKRLMEMLQGLVKAAVRALRAGKGRNRLFSVAEVIERMSSMWLEYRYGWRILWFEYNSIVKVVNDLGSEFVRRSFRATELGPTTETKDFYDNGYQNWTVHRVSSSTVRAGATGEMPITGQVSLDPLVTAWELLPLSFVIDMFWNVGDVLQAFSPTQPVKPVDSWTSTERVSHAFVEFGLSSSMPNEVMANETIVHGDIPFILRRDRTRASPEVEFISEVNLSWQRAADLGALSVVLGGMILKELAQKRP